MTRSGALAAFALALAAALPARAQVLDLLDAYRRARAGDPVLRAAAANRRAVAEGVDQARAPLRPQVWAGVSLARTHDPAPGGGSVNGGARDIGASLSQTLVDGAQLARLASAQSRSEAEDAAYLAAEQALVLRVAAAYFEQLTAMDLLANTEANEAAYLQQVTQSEQRYRNGLAAMVNVDQARAYHASARAATIAARKALADAAEALAEITGEHAAAIAPLRDELPLALPEPADAGAWVAAALQGHPLIAARRADLQAAEHAVAAARAGHLPTLSASLDVGRPAAWPAGDLAGRDGRTAASVGLQLRVPIFAGGATQSAQRQALALRDASAEALESLRRRVARETLDHYRELVAAIGQIEATRSAVEAARKALASTRVGQELGTQTMTDLLLSIQSLSAAQGAHSQARHRFVLAGLLLRQSAGRVGEADLQAVNGLLQR